MGFHFFPAFSMCLHRFGLLEPAGGVRGEGLWGVNSEGGPQTLPLSSQGCSHRCSSKLYQSIKLPS